MYRVNCLQGLFFFIQIQFSIFYYEIKQFAFDVITKYTNSRELVALKDYKRKDGKYNMCKGIQDMIKHGREEIYSTLDKSFLKML